MTWCNASSVWIAQVLDLVWVRETVSLMRLKVTGSGTREYNVVERRDRHAKLMSKLCVTWLALMCC
ncbi:unnamed protein product [Haemonchus placei]|uniref:Secreted protein n=1 Tax=Haemonchus placei TaxID=6290 RepID=A0A0N4X4K7_HAEPC|nr:unnamed protein product [Haemonchus placei]